MTPSTERSTEVSWEKNKTLIKNLFLDLQENMFQVNKPEGAH